MLNKIILIGRLTKEPESVNSAITLTSFDVAVDNPGKDAGTTFITCKCFDKTAENVAKFMHKGAKVAVDGRIQQRNFVRKDGSKGSTYEVICDRVAFLDNKPEDPSLPDSEEITDEPVLAKDSKGLEPSEEAKFDPYTGKPLKPAKSK